MTLPASLLGLESGELKPDLLPKRATVAVVRPHSAGKNEMMLHFHSHRLDRQSYRSFSSTVLE